MNDELIQLIGVAILALSEYYTVHGDASLFAPFWNLIAKISGAIANFFAMLSMRARLAYFEAVQI